MRAFEIRRARWARPVAVLALATLVVCPLAIGCARERPDGQAYIGEQGPEAAEGRVRLVGSAPFTRTVVETEPGQATVVVGPLEPEIQRLVGAEARVTGEYERTAGGPDGKAALIATAYEVLSVDGDRPLVGTLREDDDGYYLDMPNGSRQPLIAVLGVLARSTGGRVWVVLDDNGGVARYGILKEPGTNSVH